MHDRTDTSGNTDTSLAAQRQSPRSAQKFFVLGILRPRTDRESKYFASRHRKVNLRHGPRDQSCNPPKRSNTRCKRSSTNVRQSGREITLANATQAMYSPASSKTRPLSRTHVDNSVVQHDGLLDTASEANLDVGTCAVASRESSAHSSQVRQIALINSPMLTLGPILAVGSTSAVSSMKHGSMLHQGRAANDRQSRGHLISDSLGLDRNAHLSLDLLANLSSAVRA